MSRRAHVFSESTPVLRLPQTRAAKGFSVLSILFLLFLIPIQRIAAHETELVSPPGIFAVSNKTASDTSQASRTPEGGISAREQLRRRGSF